MTTCEVRRLFSKEQMLEILNDDVGEVVRDEIVGKTRWSLTHELIFALDGKLYKTLYNVGATETQDEGPWEYDKEVWCTEVERYEKTVHAYRPVLVTATDPEPAAPA